MTDEAIAIRDVIAAAGGSLVGRTRLQKTFYILEVAGFGFDFQFDYHYYGPYSEELSAAMCDAEIDGFVQEIEEVAQWGGRYSIFSLQGSEPDYELSASLVGMVKIASKADPVALELAATAAFLQLDGHEDFWGETKRRKPQKATDERVAAARKLWDSFRAVDVPTPLPKL